MSTNAGADSLPARRLPESRAEPGGEEADLTARSAGLLGHPAFVSWTLRGELLMAAAEEILRYPGWDLDRWVRRVAGELFANPEVGQAFERRLTAMSEWLLLAQDETSARMALATARVLPARPADQPFVQALVRRDLVSILSSLQETGQASGEE